MNDSPAFLQMCAIFPDKLINELMADRTFFEQLGVEAARTIVLDGKEHFDRALFFAALRQLHGGALTQSLADEAGAIWQLSFDGEDDARIVVVARDDQQIRLAPLPLLHPGRTERLAAFAAALALAGLGPNDLSEWRQRLSDRALLDDELADLEMTLSMTPQSVAARISAKLRRSTTRIDEIVPADAGYYEQLCGSQIATDVAELTGAILPEHIGRLLAVNGERGARTALLLASHGAIIPNSPIVALPAPQVEALLDWAVDHGDLWSKIGAIDLGLAKIDGNPIFELKLIALIEQLRDLDETDEIGPLKLFMATIILTGGELARHHLLEAWPPFQRRLAIFAHAALLQRCMVGHRMHARFASTSLETRGPDFFWRTLMELRLEPRWLPEHVTAEQLKNELLGRIHHAASRNQASIPEGPLHRLLFGDEGNAIPAQLRFPASFDPGPLEGGEADAAAPLPPFYDEMLQRVLEPEQLTPESLASLINLRGLFKLDNERVGRAVEIIKAAGHRFAIAINPEKRDQFLFGLACLAPIVRSTALAAELRVMVRKARIDGQDPMPPHQELTIAVIAAAAHAESKVWADYIGDWIGELAMISKTKAEAEGLLTSLKQMTAIEPALRRHASSGMAALEAFIQA